MTYRCIVVIVTLITTSLVWSYPSFRDKIPNGESVPHSCKANYLWKGVGHENSLGSGKLNPFGVDFSNERSWTKALCSKDSDGDGRTNGEELGDPKCVWKEGDVPDETLGITHPGVCDPWDSPACAASNTWVTCEQDEFLCDALNENDTRNITIRFPETVVPDTETNYYCMMFELPSDDDYHLVASTPYLDNEDVMHHALVYGCDESENEITDVEMNKPAPCGMAGHSQCTSIISAWTVGQSGQCAHPHVGYPIGTKGYRKAIFQFHWNNPMLRSDYTDSSGMTLYYTNNKRMYNSAMIMIGQEYLAIPPGMKEVHEEGICHSSCTSRLFKDKIYVTEAVNHMHYMGRQMYIEQHRYGEKIFDITNDRTYSYDSPTFYVYKNPLEISPGDELKTKCVFKSVGKDRTTFKGDGTSDEMCYGFLTVYPAENLNSHNCLSWKSLPTCELWADKKINGCRFHDFLNMANPEIINLHKETMTRCKPSLPCLTECKEYVKAIKNDVACLKGDINHYLRAYHYIFTGGKSELLKELYAAIDSCDVEIEREKLLAQYTTPVTTRCQYEIGAAPGISMSFAIMAAMAVISMLVK